MNITTTPTQPLEFPTHFPDLPGSSLTAAALSTASAKWREESNRRSQSLQASHRQVLRTIAQLRTQDDMITRTLRAAG
ncbi:hypothetical protein WG936_04820 [Corynebacterium sp. H127]|uniref:hypothetical protein n=1 Tax=Corynebacterium sp. H127 TaxID=3133418 RepID=UPI00309782F9